MTPLQIAHDNGHVDVVKFIKNFHQSTVLDFDVSDVLPRTIRIIHFLSNLHWISPLVVDKLSFRVEHRLISLDVRFGVDLVLLIDAVGWTHTEWGVHRSLSQIPSVAPLDSGLTQQCDLQIQLPLCTNLKPADNQFAKFELCNAFLTLDLRNPLRVQTGSIYFSVENRNDCCWQGWVKFNCFTLPLISKRELITATTLILTTNNCTYSGLLFLYSFCLYIFFVPYLPLVYF